MRRWLVRLYPRDWRRRYEVEFMAVLEQQPLTPGALFDIVRGAVDAHRTWGAARHQGAASSRRQTAWQREEHGMAKAREYHCSFCGKDKGPGRRLIAGPGGVYICAECVALCNAILTHEGPMAPGGQTRPKPRARWLRLLGSAVRPLRGRRHHVRQWHPLT